MLKEGCCFFKYFF